MKAIRIHEFGTPEVLRLEDVSRPAVGPGDVLIRVVAASFNPIDAKIREGSMKQALGRPLPVILGWDAAGVVEEVGASVAVFRPGDAVYTYPEFKRGGTYAEFVAVDQFQVALKPRTVSFAHAAALPMTAQAAWMAIVTTGAVAAGQRVLIHGGAGGLGSIAVQLAKARSAHVIATASAGDRALVESLGADEVIDYRAVRFQDVVREADVVLDTLGGQTQGDSWSVLKPGGVLVATAQPPSPDRARAAGVRAQFIFTLPRGDVLQQIAAPVDTGRLRPIIGMELALADARKAHEPANRSAGKVVLHVGAP
jgi:NADPH:quinone reductase-like Zn-dependent oxidoreductase